MIFDYTITDQNGRRLTLAFDLVDDETDQTIELKTINGTEIRYAPVLRELVADLTIYIRRLERNNAELRTKLENTMIRRA